MSRNHLLKFEREDTAVAQDLRWDYSPKIPALTGIRGIAACWVVLVHFGTSLSSVSGIGGLASVAIISRGYLGVDLFFILSGFVLTLNYASPRPADSKRNAIMFLVGRVFRLFPLNFAVLILLVVLVHINPMAYWGPGPFTVTSFVASMTLTQGWFSMPSAWNYPAWSLSAEWFAYLLFALSYRRLQNTLPLRTGLLQAGLCLFPFLIVLLAIRSSSVDHAERLGLLRCICEFFAGAMLCRSWRARCFSPKLADQIFLAGCCCLLLGLLLPIVEPIVLVGFSALVFACACNSPLSQVTFSSRYVIFFGDVSYSIYLTHAVILGAGLAVARSGVVREFGLSCQFAVLAASLILVIPLSYATWRFIEVPGQAAGRLYIRRLRSETAAA